MHHHASEDRQRASDSAVGIQLQQSRLGVDRARLLIPGGSMGRTGHLERKTLRDATRLEGICAGRLPDVNAAAEAPRLSGD